MPRRRRSFHVDARESPADPWLKCSPGPVAVYYGWMPFLEFRYRKPACFWFAFTACSMMFAADKDFNGRWDIQVMNEPRARVWWLSVEGAGTHGIHGSFVGAPGGDVDAIPKIWIENGQLMWQFNKR